MTSRARALALVIVVLLAAGLVGWIGLQASAAVGEKSTRPETYVATLTLAVTIVGVLAAGMGLGGSYLAWRVGGRAAKAIERAKKLEQAVEEKAAKMAAYDAMIECIFGGWGSTGMLLAEDIRSLVVTEQLRAKFPEVAEQLTALLQGLRGSMARQAVLGAHAVQLFVSTDPAMTVSSAQALAGSGRREAIRLVEKRIEIESMKDHPDTKLLRSLSDLHSAFSAP